MTLKSLNKNLRKASREKKDEFYTQLVDIEKELKHYKDQFRARLFIVIAMIHTRAIFLNTSHPTSMRLV